MPADGEVRAHACAQQNGLAFSRMLHFTALRTSCFTLAAVKRCAAGLRVTFASAAGYRKNFFFRLFAAVLLAATAGQQSVSTHAHTYARTHRLTVQSNITCARDWVWFAEKKVQMLSTDSLCCFKDYVCVCVFDQIEIVKTTMSMSRLLQKVIDVEICFVVIIEIKLKKKSVSVCVFLFMFYVFRCS